nr:hypothetical protein [Rhizobium sullae]
MDMIFHGWSTSLFHVAQQWVTMSLQSLKIRLESQLSPMSFDIHCKQSSQLSAFSYWHRGSGLFEAAYGWRQSFENDG